MGIGQKAFDPLFLQRGTLGHFFLASLSKHLSLLVDDEMYD